MLDRDAILNLLSIHKTDLAQMGVISIALFGSAARDEARPDSDVDKAEWKTLKCPKTPKIYQRFIDSILSGKNDQPDYARGAQVQKLLDLCFESDKEGKRLAV